MSYKEKYIKYKNKYLELKYKNIFINKNSQNKNMVGGTCSDSEELLTQTEVTIDNMTGGNSEVINDNNVAELFNQQGGISKKKKKKKTLANFFKTNVSSSDSESLDSSTNIDSSTDSNLSSSM